MVGRTENNWVLPVERRDWNVEVDVNDCFSYSYLRGK